MGLSEKSGNAHECHCSRPSPLFEEVVVECEMGLVVETELQTSAVGLNYWAADLQRDLRPSLVEVVAVVAVAAGNAAVFRYAGGPGLGFQTEMLGRG